MNRIMKDTPVGTRVQLLASLLLRGVICERNGSLVSVLTADGSRYVLNESQVYLDEPAPGTWAWACEMAIAGNVPVRPLGDGSYNRLIYTEGSDELSMQCCTHGTYIEESIGRFDVDATNWEIGK